MVCTENNFNLLRSHRTHLDSELSVVSSYKSVFLREIRVSYQDSQFQKLRMIWISTLTHIRRFIILRVLLLHQPFGQTYLTYVIKVFDWFDYTLHIFIQKRPSKGDFSKEILFKLQLYIQFNLPEELQLL